MVILLFWYYSRHITALVVDLLFTLPRISIRQTRGRLVMLGTQRPSRASTAVRLQKANTCPFSASSSGLYEYGCGAGVRTRLGNRVPDLLYIFSTSRRKSASCNLSTTSCWIVEKMLGYGWGGLIASFHPFPAGSPAGTSVNGALDVL